MNYAKIKHYCIQNGPGLRTALFVQGCDIHCPGCFNQDTWSFTGGKPFDSNAIVEIVSSLNEHGDHIAGLSILGGEPLSRMGANRVTVTAFCAFIKREFPSKSIWLWTGYEWPKIKDLEVMNYIDVCVAGPFDVTKRDLSLKWCGSSNQQVIDVKKTKEAGKVVSYEE